MSRFEFDEEERPAGRVYLDEADPRDRRRFYFKLFGFGGMALLLVLAAAGVYFFYYKDRVPGQGFLADKLEKIDLEGIVDRYYFPAGSYSPPLQKAIAFYKENDRARARRAFEEFVESAASDTEKSIALVYLGIMAMEVERFAEAQHQLLRARRFDEKNLAALVNLAITERKLGNPQEAREIAMRARNLAPDDSRVAVLLGNILSDIQDLPGAISAYREGLKGDAHDPYLYYNLALSLLRAGNLEEAALYFARSIELAPTGQMAVTSHAHLGQLYFSQNRLEMAADHLNRAVQLAPANAKYLYNLAVVYMRMGQNERAIELLDRALATSSDEGRVYRSLALAYQELGLVSRAESALQKALFANPNDLSALQDLGELYTKEKHLVKALDIYKRIVNITPGDSNTREALLALSRIYTDLERPVDALAMLERARELSPGDTAVEASRAATLARSGRIDEAVQLYRQLLTAKLEREDEQRLRLELGRLYRSHGGYDLAIAQFQLNLARAKEEPPRADLVSEMELARTYVRLSRPELARKHYEAVLASPAVSAAMRQEAHLELAQALTTSPDRNDQDEARRHASQATRMAPDSARARLVQGRVLLSSDSVVDREKAIEILRALSHTDLSPALASQVQDSLGQAYYKNGEYERALKAFDQAVALDGSNQSAYRNQRLAASAYEESLKR